VVGDHAAGCGDRLVALQGLGRVPQGGVQQQDKGQWSSAAARENLTKAGETIHHEDKQRKRGHGRFWNRCS